MLVELLVDDNGGLAAVAFFADSVRKLNILLVCRRHALSTLVLFQRTVMNRRCRRFGRLLARLLLVEHQLELRLPQQCLVHQ